MNWRPAQIHYLWYERLFMRVLFALVVKEHVPASLSQFNLSAPNGFARFVDLHFLLDPGVFQICRYLCWLALGLYVLRVAWSIALPYLTLLSAAVGSIVNSQGAIGHFYQIVSLVLCAQTFAHFYSWWKKRRGRETIDRSLAEDRVIYWSQQTIVATYLVSALTKLIHTSGKWFLQSPLIAVQIVKTNEQNYYDRLDATASGSSAAIAEWIVHHPLLVALILSCGLILELTSPLALLGRRFALCYGLGLVVFHESVYRVMKLQFTNNEYLIWIFLVNVPFWAMAIAFRLRRQIRH